MISIKATISGKVQGVYFRASTQDLAKQLGIVGYVQNQANGSVLVVATGSKEKIDELIQFLSIGPSQAVVARIDIEPLQTRTFDSFEQKKGLAVLTYFFD